MFRGSGPTTLLSARHKWRGPHLTTLRTPDTSTQAEHNGSVSLSSLPSSPPVLLPTKLFHPIQRGSLEVHAIAPLRRVPKDKVGQSSASSDLFFGTPELWCRDVVADAEVFGGGGLHMCLGCAFALDKLGLAWVGACSWPRPLSEPPRTVLPPPRSRSRQARANPCGRVSTSCSRHCSGLVGGGTPRWCQERRKTSKRGREDAC